MLAARPALLRDAAARSLAYLEEIEDRPVAPSVEYVAKLDELDFGLGERRAFCCLVPLPAAGGKRQPEELALREDARNPQLRAHEGKELKRAAQVLIRLDAE